MQKREYPIKYALYPVKEYRGDDRREYKELVCFIISKAYVMERNSYLTNTGERKFTYKICYPHTIYDGRVSYLHITPESPVLNDHLNVTANLYDTYEDALEDKDEKNLKYNPNTVDKYNILETEILELENDMNITKNNNEKRLVKN